MSTLQQLTTPLTPAEVKASIYAGIALAGVNTTTWKPGAVTRTIIAVVAVVLAAFSRLTAEIAKGGFLELATGDWLDLVGVHVFGTPRDEGAFATGTVKLTNTAGGSFVAVPIGDLIVKNAAGKTYRNTAVFTLNAAPATVTVPIQADELGTDSNAGVGDIDEFVTAFVGVDVENEVPVVGADRESDTAYRTRCRESTGILSPNGPRDAYAYIAKGAKRADGTSIGVTRVRVVADGMGGVDVYVADPDGTLTGDADDPDTDLGAVAKAIWDQVEPLAVTARLHAATALVVPVTIEVWIRDITPKTDAELVELVEVDTLPAFFGEQPIGGEVILPAAGKVYVDAISAAVTDVLIDEGGCRILKIDVNLPSSDVDVAGTEAPVMGAFAMTIHRVNARGVT